MRGPAFLPIRSALFYSTCKKSQYFEEFFLPPRAGARKDDSLEKPVSLDSPSHFLVYSGHRTPIHQSPLLRPKGPARTMKRLDPTINAEKIQLEILIDYGKPWT